jgi:hypothetical protein
MLILGLDPGGNRQFGWFVGEPTAGHRLRLLRCGSANHAEGAVAQASQYLGGSTQLAAAGIDSPLFWTANGDRQCDKTVRMAMKAVGASAIGGTVQSVNSLRGACLIQGTMAAWLLRRKFPSIRLTESHPKALLWLVKVASLQRPVSEVTMTHLAEFLECNTQGLSEHERDAAIGAIGAMAMLLRLEGWRDIVEDEQNPFVPVSPVEYWMPIRKSRDAERNA